MTQRAFLTGTLGTALLALSATTTLAQDTDAPRAHPNAMIDHLQSKVPDANPDERVLRGKAADNYGFQVALLRPDGSQFCGGSVIGPRHVLTAAHCVEFTTGEDITVLHGTTKLDTGGTRVAVAGDPIVHARYSNTQIDRDIAILPLAQDLPGPYVALANPDGSDEMPGRAATVIGWGISDAAAGTAPNDLLEGEQTLLSLSECRDLVANWSPYMRVTDRMICGQHGVVTGGPCYGDSGGAMFVTDPDGTHRQAGVVSWGYPGCESPESLALYARVSAFDPWLQDATAAQPDLVAMAQTHADVTLDKIEYRRRLDQARPFEQRAWKAVGPAIEDIFGALPDPDDVKISAQYVGDAGDGSLARLTVFFSIPDIGDTRTAVIAMTEDSDHYHFAGLLPFADDSYLVENMKLRDWKPIAVMVNGKPHLFTYDNSDFVYQPFDKTNADQLSLMRGQRALAQ